MGENKQRKLLRIKYLIGEEKDRKVFMLKNQWEKMNRENYLCFQLQNGENEDRKLILLKTEYCVIGNN